MDAIFLDTNRIANKDTNTFFGEIDKYARLANLAQVHIPSIVMDEIKFQKLRELESSLASFKCNYFTAHLGCDLSGLEQHMQARIEELYQNAPQEIDHIELGLQKDQDHMDFVKELALKKHPPFDRKTDKGFKDAYIFLIIQQFLENNANSDVFLFTEDGRLKEAFKNNKRVKVLLEPEEYFSYREAYFKSDYFLGVLQQSFSDMDEIEEEITLSVENIMSINLTEDDDWKILIRIPNIGTFEILVDFASKEIIAITDLGR